MKRTISKDKTQIQSPLTKSRKSSEKHKKEREQLQKALKRVNSEEVLHWMKDGGLIQLDSNDTLNSTLSLLKEKRILAAPVWDKVTEEYLGFVDMVDIAAVAVQIQESSGAAKQIEKSSLKKENLVDNEEFDSMEFEERSMMNALSAVAISDISRRNPFVTVSTSDSIFDVCMILESLHRVGVISSDGKFRGLITQTGLLEYLTEEHAEIFNKLSSKSTIKELDLIREVETIERTETALKAFQKMRDSKISGLAVTENGKFKDVISATDMMLWAEWILFNYPIRFSNLSSLRKSISEFLAESRAQQKNYQRNLTLNWDATVEEAVNVMIMQHVHRLFVLEKEKPIAVITLDSILSFLVDPKQIKES